jgi:ketosteroid isomerase-like protein
VKKSFVEMRSGSFLALRGGADHARDSVRARGYGFGMKEDKEDSDPLAVERRFFAALIEGNVKELKRLLDEDFVLIDVMSGSEIGKAALLAAIGLGQLKFEAIEPLEARVRRYGATAIITGRTRMNGRFETTPFEAHSRYTHVFFQEQGRWRLVSAQGTPITVAQ